MQRCWITKLTILYLLAVIAICFGYSPVAAAATEYHKPLDSYPNTNGYEGFGAQRGGGRYHVGTDYGAGVGSSVYALYDGTVLYADEYSGFGSVSPDRPGGAIVIRHRTPDGQEFFALYGHIERIRHIKPQDVVKRGQVLGKISAFYNNGIFMPHLHLGIYTGKTFPLSGWGTTKVKQGWVAPTVFLDKGPGNIIRPIKQTLPTVQDGFTIRGVISESSTDGNLLVGAVVSLGDQKVKTGLNGEFCFENVEEGTYPLIVTKKGYKNLKIAGFRVSRNHENIRLSLLTKK